MTAVHMRLAKIDDVRTMLDWAHAEGWNPGLEDAEAFYSTDPGGFFLAEVEGVPVASISMVNHSDDFAFLGLYVCRQQFRGRGIGFALWKHALEHAGPRTIGLDGVAAQESNYAKSGFFRTGSTMRLEGRLRPANPAGTREANDGDLAEIVRLDEAANGMSRNSFLAAWLSAAQSRRTVVACNGSRVLGFATIRECRNGAKIGPIVAPNSTCALALATAAVNALPSERVIIDVPSQNEDFSSRLKNLGFAETFATARMYRGMSPRQTAGLTAIATMELG